MNWLVGIIGLGVGVSLGVAITWVIARRHARRVRRADRLAWDATRSVEIGAMTAGLAHEIKNPLSTIGLNAELLGEGIDDLDMEDSDRARLDRRVSSLRREADRLRDILTDFLRFAGEVKLDCQRTNINAVIEELTDFYQPQAAHHRVRLRTDLSAAPLDVMLDAPAFKQAILNLLINATQAMEHPSQGARELILRTREVAGDADPACEVHVIDTGPGIDADTLEHIFTPYFTTKGGGSGLGLSVTRRIIQEHQGSITVHSELNRGTDFAILLPCASHDAHEDNAS